MADSRLLDRRPHEVAPLRPGAVVVLHVRVAEEVLEDEPGVGRPLPDPAVRDDLLVRSDALVFVQGLEILSRLERAVLVHGLGPGNVLRPGNVPASLRVFRRIFRRRKDLSREFLRRSHVDEDFVLLLDRLPHVVQVYAEGLVRFLRREGRLGERGDVFRDRETLLDPLLPPAVKEDDVVDAVVLEHPEDERSEPVVEVAVEDDLVVVRDPEPAEERLEALFRDDVSAHRIVDVLLPVDQDGPRDVPEVVVRRGIVIDLDDADVLIPQTSFHPARVDQYFGMRVCRHGFHASDASEVIRCYILCSYRYSYPTKRSSKDGISINGTTFFATSAAYFEISRGSMPQSETRAPPVSWRGRFVSRSVNAVVAIGILGFLLASPIGVDALVDDLEDDFWMPFTHFHLGDRASAGYSNGVAKSGGRSYHVGISGWAIRDFGAAYGYGYFTTHKAPITELRVSVLYERLEDSVASPWDAFAAGVRLDLLDWRLRSVGSVRYVTEYHESRNGGRCAPTTSDVVLETPSGPGAWTEVGRSPASDFPDARWGSAEYVRISIGFLCAAGLTGASYSLYLDDFLLDTGAGDSDGDGLRDLEEEATHYGVRVDSGSVPSDLRPMNTTAVSLTVPAAAGAFAS